MTKIEVVELSKKVIELAGRKSEILSAGFRAGDFIYTSGQVGRNFLTGKVGDTIQEQTKQALENINSVLKNAGASMNDVVKITVFLQDVKDFDEMNKIYVTFFDEPKPARSCIVTKLVRPNYKIEIEAIAYKPQK